MPSRVLKLTKAKRNPITFLAIGNNLQYRNKSGTGSLTGSGALRYQPGNGGRVNWCRNPRGTGAGFWAFNGSGTVNAGIAVNDHPLGIDTAVRMAGSVALDGGTMVGSTISKPTSAYTVSFYAKLESGAADWHIRWAYRSAAGASLYESQFNVFTPTSEWQRFSFTQTPSGSGVGIHTLNVKFVRTSGVAGQILVTGVVVEQTGSALPYFDGSDPGCAWIDPLTGVAGVVNSTASVSRAAFWPEEPTTNLAANPSGEHATVTTAMSPYGVTAPTITRDTAYAYLGSASYKVVTAGAGVNEGIGVNTNSSLGYTGSARTFSTSGYLRGSGTVEVWSRVLYTDLSPADGVHTTYTLTDTWTRVIPAPITLNPAKTVNRLEFVVRTFGTAAITFYVDAVQIEEKPYVTSYCDGALGAGYSWTGTAHGSASSRSLTQVFTNVAGNWIHSARGTAVVAVQPPTPLQNGGGARVFFGAGAFNTADWISFNTEAANKPQFRYKVGAGPIRTTGLSGALSTGTWYLMAGSWDGTTTSISRDVTAQTASGTRDAPGSLPQSLIIGYGSSTEAWGGLIGPVALFDRVLTSAELSILQNTDPTLWWNALA